MYLDFFLKSGKRNSNAIVHLGLYVSAEHVSWILICQFLGHYFFQGRHITMTLCPNASAESAIFSAILVERIYIGSCISITCHIQAVLKMVWESWGGVPLTSYPFSLSPPSVYHPTPPWARGA